MDQEGKQGKNLPISDILLKAWKLSRRMPHSPCFLFKSCFLPWVDSYFSETEKKQFPESFNRAQAPVSS